MARKPNEMRPIMTRIPEALRARLAKEAGRNDRSMNAEIIHRLEASFTAPERLAEIFGGERNLALLRTLSGCIEFVEAATGKQWDQDVEARRLLMTLVLKAIHDFASHGSWQQRIAAKLMGKTLEPTKDEFDLEQAIQTIASIEREKP